MTNRHKLKKCKEKPLCDWCNSNADDIYCNYERYYSDVLKSGKFLLYFESIHEVNVRVYIPNKIFSKKWLERD